MLLAEGDAVLIDVGDGFAEANLDAELFERAPCVVGKALREGAENTRRRFNQNDARRFRIDAAIVAGERLVGELGDGAGGFDAGRAAADDDEGGEARAFGRVGFEFGVFEGEQDALALFGGVFERFEARREFFPIVVAEIGVARAGGDDEKIVGHAAFAENDFARWRCRWLRRCQVRH